MADIKGARGISAMAISGQLPAAAACRYAPVRPGPAGRAIWRGSNAGAGAIRRRAALRRHSGARPRALQELLLDTLACAVAGRGEETEQVAALASGLAQSNESSVIGGDRLSLAGATMLNGYLVTAVTMCDVHRSTLTHVTPEVMPPALAIAERDGLSGRDCWSPSPPAAR